MSCRFWPKRKFLSNLKVVGIPVISCTPLIWASNSFNLLIAVRISAIFALSSSMVMSLIGFSNVGIEISGVEVGVGAVVGEEVGVGAGAT